MGDFGLATVIDQNEMDSSSGRQSSCVQRTAKKGTKDYMSPEQVKRLTYVVAVMMQ